MRIITDKLTEVNGKLGGLADVLDGFFSEDLDERIGTGMSAALT